MKFKNTIIISSYVLLAALLFSGSFVLGRTHTRTVVPIVTPPPVSDAVETISEGADVPPFYLVTAENGKLVIYKCAGEDKSALASEEISESVFPSEDIAELRRGVRFDSLDKAQELFENFVS